MFLLLQSVQKESILLLLSWIAWSRLQSNPLLHTLFSVLYGFLMHLEGWYGFYVPNPLFMIYLYILSRYPFYSNRKIFSLIKRTHIGKYMFPKSRFSMYQVIIPPPSFACQRQALCFKNELSIAFYIVCISVKLICSFSVADDHTAC